MEPVGGRGGLTASGHAELALPVTKEGLYEQRVALGAAIHGREQLITR